MIARGQIHSSGPKLAAYLVNGKKGETAELVELRGVAADDLREAFTDLQNIADGMTKAEKPFFHAHIRLPDGEKLTREQWLKVADRMEAVLGFEGQPRAVAFHQNASHEEHMHVAWSRIDLDNMKAIDPGLFALKMRDEARKLEVEFGLQQVSNAPNADRLTKSAKRGEFEQARRLDTDLDAIRNGIRQAWDRSDDGQSFQAAIGDRGWILARGDRREFVVVDHMGGDHALGRRVCGVTAGEVKTRLGGDEFKATLPTVDEAKAMQRERQQQAEKEGRGGRDDMPAAPEKVRSADATAGTRRAEKAVHGMEKAATKSFGAMVTGGEKLIDLVGGAADFFFATPRTVTPQEAAASSAAMVEYMQASAFERRREMAYDRMMEERAAGKHLTRDDVRYLSEADRANYRAHGDTALDQMFRDREIEEERKRARHREL